MSNSDPIFTPVLQVCSSCYALIPTSVWRRSDKIARIGVARLEIGLSVADYGTTVRQLADAQAVVETQAVLGAALDTLESLIVNACPSLPERLGFCVQIGDLIRKWYRRVDRADILLFNNLALDIGGPAIQALGEPERRRCGRRRGRRGAAISGKTIALYSLQENALR